MNKHLHFIFFITSFFLASFSFAQLNNNCANAVNVCNNQLAEQLDDGLWCSGMPNWWLWLYVGWRKKHSLV
jgi:hypothetical protein